jgi:hypothetical protein
VIVCNTRGALNAADTEHLDPERAALARRTDKQGRRGTPDEVLSEPTCCLACRAPAPFRRRA